MSTAYGTSEPPTTFVTDPSGNKITSTSAFTTSAPESTTRSTTVYETEPFPLRTGTLRARDTIPGNVPDDPISPIELTPEDDDESISSPPGHLEEFGGDTPPVIHRPIVPEAIAPRPISETEPVNRPADTYTPSANRTDRAALPQELYTTPAANTTVRAAPPPEIDLPQQPAPQDLLPSQGPPAQETPAPDEAHTGTTAQSITQSFKDKAKSALDSLVGHHDKRASPDHTSRSSSVKPEQPPRSTSVPIPLDPATAPRSSSSHSSPNPAKESRLKRYFRPTGSAPKSRIPLRTPPARRDSGKYFLDTDVHHLAHSSASAAPEKAPPAAGGNTVEPQERRQSVTHKLQSSMRPGGAPQAPRRTQRVPSTSYFHPTPGRHSKVQIQSPGTDISTPATVKSFNRRQAARREGSHHISFPTTTTVTTSEANPNPTVVTTAGRAEEGRREENDGVPNATVTEGDYGRAVRPVISGHEVQEGEVVQTSTSYEQPIAPETQTDQPKLQPAVSPVVEVYKSHYTDDQDDVVQAPQSKEQEAGTLVENAAPPPEASPGEPLHPVSSSVYTERGTEQELPLMPVASSVYTYQATPLIIEDADEDIVATGHAEDFLTHSEFELAAKGADAALHEADKDHGGFREQGNIGGLRVLDETREIPRRLRTAPWRGRTGEWVETERRRSFSFVRGGRDEVLELVESGSSSLSENEGLPFPRGSHQFAGAQGAHYKPGVHVPPLLDRTKRRTAASAAAAALYGTRPVTVFNVTSEFYNEQFPGGTRHLRTTLDQGKYQHKPVRLSNHEWGNSRDAASKVLQIGKFAPTEEELEAREEAREMDRAMQAALAEARNGHVERAARIAHRGGVAEEFAEEIRREDAVGLTGARLAAANARRGGTRGVDVRGAAVRAAIANHDILMSTARERARQRLDGIDAELEERAIYNPKRARTNLSQAQLAHMAAERRREERDREGVPEGCVSIGAGGYVERSRLEAIARERLGPMLDEIHDEAEERRGRELTEKLDKEEAKRQRQISKERRRETERELKMAKRQRKSRPSTATTTPTRASTVPTHTSNTAIHQPSEPPTRQATRRGSANTSSSSAAPLSTSTSQAGSTTMLDALRLGSAPTPPRRSIAHGIKRFFMYRYHEEDPLICTPPAAYKSRGSKEPTPAASAQGSRVHNSIPEEEVDRLGDAVPAGRIQDLPIRETPVRTFTGPDNGTVPSTASVHSAPLVSTATQAKLERLETLQQASTAPHNLGTSAGAAAVATEEKEERERMEEEERQRMERSRTPSRSFQSFETVEGQEMVQPNEVEEYHSPSPASVSAPTEAEVEDSDSGRYEDAPYAPYSTTPSEVAITTTEANSSSPPRPVSQGEEVSRHSSRDDSGVAVPEDEGDEEEAVTPRIRKFTDTYASALKWARDEEEEEEEGGDQGKRVELGDEGRGGIPVLNAEPVGEFMGMGKA
ncbi:hypothetical protein BJ508DRAFT_332200 [Ascobolus immersus RN42]|uniref:Uncharacterized protein n=1 Tax=Ascobolus immersus RN42 TaxID=1160509 RepID=A0A3N4HTI9_ASCIM|nr:hypothetical protein BJ508DRAFT_332200 [Ascobolus immersus RN42]